MKKQYNIIDLFCGCGGLSKGFEEAGYKTLLGVDIEQAALNTFEKNHKGAVGMNLDITDFDDAILCDIDACRLKIEYNQRFF